MALVVDLTYLKNRTYNLQWDNTYTERLSRWTFYGLLTTAMLEYLQKKAGVLPDPYGPLSAELQSSEIRRMNDEMQKVTTLDKLSNSSNSSLSSNKKRILGVLTCPIYLQLEQT